MSETYFEEGGSFNSFEKSINGQISSKVTNKYSILGTNMEDLFQKKVLPIPNYIKIDVDGIENLILLGMGKYLKHKSIRSILIEAEKKNKLKETLKILKKCGFKLTSKHGLNYIFNRLNK